MSAKAEWVERTRLARGDVIAAADELAEACEWKQRAEFRVRAARKTLDEAVFALAKCAVPVESEGRDG